MFGENYSLVMYGQVALILIAYFIGCINPSILMGKARGIDVKKEGSGNAGATNTLRLLGKKAALISLSVDIIKGIVGTSLGYILDDSGQIAGYCAIAVFLGHIFPCFYNFNGGKGVATCFGAVLVLDWRVALLSLAVAAVVTLITRRMSAGSIVAAVALSVFMKIINGYFFLIAFAMTLVILYKHKDNVGRIIRGEEPTLNFRKESK